jgi:hypothetical protein
MYFHERTNDQPVAALRIEVCASRHPLQTPWQDQAHEDGGAIDAGQQNQD